MEYPRRSPPFEPASAKAFSIGYAWTMNKVFSAILLLSLPSLVACPDPPPEIAGYTEEVAATQATRPNKGGREGDPDSMDLSPGGTMLLDLSKVTPQQSQEELRASGAEVITISGKLSGTCDGGMVRIDVIEVGIEHVDSGPMVGPLTALTPEAIGEYSLIVPKGKNIQIAAVCDLDNDGKIVQNTDKLAPGVAMGVLEEDGERIGIDLAFPGDGDTPVQIGSPNGEVQPPGDPTASIPSTEAGDRDRAQDGAPPPAEGSVPPPPEEDTPPPSEDEATPSPDSETAPKTADEPATTEG